MEYGIPVHRLRIPWMLGEGDRVRIPMMLSEGDRLRIPWMLNEGDTNGGRLLLQSRMSSCFLITRAQFYPN